MQEGDKVRLVQNHAVTGVVADTCLRGRLIPVVIPGMTWPSLFDPDDWELIPPVFAVGDKVKLKVGTQLVGTVTQVKDNEVICVVWPWTKQSSNYAGGNNTNTAFVERFEGLD